MSFKFGNSAFISASEAEKQLAIPVLYILSGIAKAIFPKSTPSKPSSEVHIVRLKQSRIPDVYGTSFPVSVNAEQWNLGVVPVLSDPYWDLRKARMKTALQSGRIDQEVEQLGKALYASFEKNGWSI